jgi:hypothetical protein
MFKPERDTLRVDVPVGFLLPEPREIAVSVDRPSDTPLSIRLRLIPAQVEGLPALARTPASDSAVTPRPARSRAARPADDDGYPDVDLGGGD